MFAQRWQKRQVSLEQSRNCDLPASNVLLCYTDKMKTESIYLDKSPVIEQSSLCPRNTGVR